MHSSSLKIFRRLIGMFIATVMAIQAASTSNADLIISIPHVTVAPGGSGYLDVLIHSDAVGGDSFQNYFLDFTISGAAQAAAPINFVLSIITAPQLSATGPDYIFLGDSAEFNAPIGLDSVSDQPGNPVANDLITVSDLTNSGLDRTILSGEGNFLLARLNFIAPLSATPGNVYNINLENTSIFEDTGLILSAYTSNIGSITISSAAVPEPGTIGALAIAGLVAGWRRYRQQKGTLLTYVDLTDSHARKPEASCNALL